MSRDCGRGGQEGSFNSEKLKVSSCCKHYTAAYDVDNWKGKVLIDSNLMQRYG